MTFLAPMTGLIAAALAVPALLLLYFLKLRRRQVRVSSTLLWWHAVQDLQVNTPFRWLRVSVLLILQMLALVALLIAVARPALPEDGPGGSRVVIVIDRSASMSAGDGAKAGVEASTRLEEAQRRAEELVGKLARRGGGWGFGFGGGGGGDWQACVVTFAARAEALTGFTSDAGALREAIEGVTPTDQPADLAGLVRFVDALSGATSEEAEAGGGGAAERTKVYVFSDGSFAMRETMAPPRGVDAELMRVGPAPATEKDEVESRNNLGVVSVSARRDYEDPGVVRVFARVLNAGAGSEEALVELSVDGETVQTRTLAVAGVGPDKAPGEASLTFELENATGGLAVVSLRRSDLLNSDDAAGLVLAPSGKARVLMVAPDVVDGVGGVDTYLSSVLEAMDLRDLRVVTKDAYERMMVQARAGGGAAIGDTGVPDLRDWDLVVFDRVRPEEVPTLPSVSFGAGLPIAGVSVGSVEGENGAERVVSWQRTHPVLRYVSLDQVLVAPPVVLGLPSEGGGGNADVLVWGEHGGLIGVLEGADGLRRVMVAFDIGRSNWGPDFSFPVFLSNAVEYLTTRGQAAAGSFVRTTEAVRVRPAVGAAEVSVMGPVSVRVPVKQGAEAVTIGQLERAGVYTVQGGSVGAIGGAGSGGGGGAPERLVVNLCDPTESLLRTSDELLMGGLARPSAGGDGEGMREVWHWFVAGAFLLLVVEWFYGAWRMRT